jgi:hypothetical protein
VGPENSATSLVPLSTVLTVILAGPPPKTMTKEWQEASNERARELNLDPITGKLTDNSVPQIPRSRGLACRCTIRGLFREGVRAIQVDFRSNQVEPRADPLDRILWLCFIHLAIIKYFYYPSPDPRQDPGKWDDVHFI